MLAIFLALPAGADMLWRGPCAVEWTPSANAPTDMRYAVETTSGQALGITAATRLDVPGISWPEPRDVRVIPLLADGTLRRDIASEPSIPFLCAVSSYQPDCDGDGNVDSLDYGRCFLPLFRGAELAP